MKELKCDDSSKALNRITIKNQEISLVYLNRFLNLETQRTDIWIVFCTECRYRQEINAVL
jgi:hypothetical protein